MKIVHFGEFAPHRCGLYHTMKDLIKAERGVGIDAHFVDAKGEKGICKVQPGGKIDGWLTTSDIKVAKDADLFVRHTIIPNELENCGIPLLLAIHGRPESSLLLDEAGTIPVIEAFYNKGRDERYKGFFTFWPEHLPFWRHIIPEQKLYYVPAMVDLMEWRPGSVKPFDFGKHNGSPNILIADIWRDDVTPFEEVMAVAKFIQEECPDGRLHIAAAPTGKGANAFYIGLRKAKVLGIACGQTSKIKELYEAADVIVTPHTIATRVVREGLAMATPVIRKDGLRQWLKDYRVRDQHIKRFARKTAEERFNIKQAGQAMLQIIEKVLERKSQRRKVLIDLGGHLAETVRRFYKEVPDARFYDIFTLEPHPDCFNKMQQIIGRLKNVQFVKRAIGKPGNNRFTRLYPGKINNGDGSTLLKGKTTGGIDYTKPIVVVVQTLQKFMKEYEIHSDDYVILKMNVEGAEYEIMQEILDAGLMKYFNQIYVMLHKKKLDQKDYNQYWELEKKFEAKAKAAGVQVFMTEKGMARFQCEEVMG